MNKICILHYPIPKHFSTISKGFIINRIHLSRADAKKNVIIEKLNYQMNPNLGIFMTMLRWYFS